MCLKFYMIHPKKACIIFIQAQRNNLKNNLAYFLPILTNSTSKTSAEFGGMVAPMPLSP